VALVDQRGRDLPCEVRVEVAVKVADDLAKDRAEVALPDRVL
jgi:hypothetical protein